MRKNNMDIDSILVHKGIGNILFGMSKQEILDCIDSEYIEEVDEDGDIDIIFPSLGLRFTLWKDFDLKLGAIESFRQKIEIHGVNLYGKTKKEIRSFILDQMSCNISNEDGCEHEDGDIQEWIDVDSISSSFWFMNDSLSQIYWSCQLSY